MQVDPKVGLHALFCIAVLTVIVDKRPGMISAAKAASIVKIAGAMGISECFMGSKVTDDSA